MENIQDINSKIIIQTLQNDGKTPDIYEDECKKTKKTYDIKKYHKEYKQNNLIWKEYLSNYVDKNKDKLNEKKRNDRKNKNELFNLIKKCLEEKTIIFINDKDLSYASDLILYKINKISV